MLYIYEPTAEGHHLLYVRAIVDGAADSFDQIVWLTTAGALASDEAQVHLGDALADGRLGTRSLPEPTSPGALATLQHWLRVRRIVRERDAVLAVPHGDRVFVWWMLLGRRRVPGHFLFMRPPNPAVQGRLRRARHRVKGALLDSAAVSRTFFVHPLVSREGAGITSARWATPVMDPITTRPVTREAARERFDIAVDRVTCGVVGVLSERKGIAELVQTWKGLAAPRPLLLLAGKPDETVASVLRSDDVRDLVASGDVKVVAGYLSNADVDLAVAALDLSLQLYDNSEGPSGIYAKAKDLGVPVLTYVGSTYLTSEIQRWGNGSVCTDLSEASLRRSIEDCVSRIEELSAAAKSARPAQATAMQFAEQLGLVPVVTPSSS